MDFIDTNVLIYAYDSSDSRHEAARDLVLRLARERAAAISVQVLQEFHVNVVSKIAVPLSPKQARDRLRAFSRWPTHSPIALDVVVASELAERHQLSFWDAMILHSASEMGCQTVWTEDLNAGQVIGGVTVSNPFQRSP